MKQLFLSSFFLVLLVIAANSAQASDYVCSGSVQSKNSERVLKKKYVRFNTNQDISSADIYSEKDIKVSVFVENTKANTSYLTIMATNPMNQINSVAKGLAKNLVILAVTHGQSTYSIGCSPMLSQNKSPESNTNVSKVK